MAIKRMTGPELRAIREQRGETGEAFGAHLGRIVGQLLDVERAYSRQHVYAWESGLRAVPAEIELALIKAGDVPATAAKKRAIGALVARGRIIKP